ncbi:tetratricopeptide repeat protein [Aquirufa sp. ROCK-SH2]
MIRFLALLFIVCLTWSCSQYSTKPFSIAFHNINAKYNAIWQAERLQKSVQTKLAEESTENYNKTLPIIAEIDTIQGKKYAAEIEKIIKKASIVIDRHQNSRFIDNAYVLIGNGRVLQNDFKNAIETYKYVNSIDHDESSQIASLMALYQIYIFQNDFTSAEKVAEFIQEQDLNKSQKKNFYLSKAYFHQKRGENLVAIALIEEALPLMKSGNEKARLYYILGQLFQEEKKYTLASDYFKKVDSNKPSYELQFHSKLSSNQLSGSLEKLLSMLKEPKNEGNKAMIYMAIGQIYYEKNDFEKAKEYWEKGAENNPDKGILYLQLGNLFAKKIRNFELASQYYDSAATYVTSSHPEFASIQKLKKTWKEYTVLNKKILDTDSLISLSKKSEAELKSIYQQMKQKESIKKDSVQTKTVTPIVAINQVVFTRRPSSPEQQSFYFYNDMIRIQGKQEFLNKWPNRTLEDFWNRKNKNQSSNNLENSETTTSQIPLKNNTSEKNTLASNIEKGDSLQIWLASIPKSEVEKSVVQKTLEKSIFELGKFSKIEIGDNDLTQTTLGRLLKEFPSTTYEAETLYLLYLSNSNQSKIQKEFRKQLFEKYPESHFKSLILKIENGTLSEGKEIEAQKAYEKAYTNYKARNFQESFNQCLSIEQQFPGSNLEDKVLFLKALNKGELKDLSSYEEILKIFIQTFPKSTLKTDAQELLQALNKNKR